MANVLAAPLKELSNTISGFCAKDGYLVMSGILSEQATSVMDAYDTEFKFSPVKQQGEWIRLSACKYA